MTLNVTITLMCDKNYKRGTSYPRLTWKMVIKMSQHVLMLTHRNFWFTCTRYCNHVLHTVYIVLGHFD